MALVIGTNCGFVTVAPIGDPLGYSFSYRVTSNNGGECYAMKVVIADAITVTEIGWYEGFSFGYSGALTARWGIYSHDAGNDRQDALISEEVGTVTRGTGWHVKAFSKDLAAGTYWLAAQVDYWVPENTTLFVDRENGTGEKVDRLAPDQTELPDPWGVSDDTYDSSLAIYALYVDRSLSPSASPSVSPSVSISPSISPSVSPSVSISPSISPSLSPSISPSVSPSISPSLSPSISPSISPSVSPSVSLSPSISPSVSPSVSLSPSISPSVSPSISPSPSPSLSPSFRWDIHQKVMLK